MGTEKTYLAAAPDSRSRRLATHNEVRELRASQKFQDFDGNGHGKGSQRVEFKIIRREIEWRCEPSQLESDEASN